MYPRYVNTNQVHTTMYRDVINEMNNDDHEAVLLLLGMEYINVTVTVINNSMHGGYKITRTAWRIYKITGTAWRI